MRDKLTAFLIHLAISLIMAIISLSVVYLVWNPYPLYKATGITHIFLLMLTIDLIVGPVLTFIVYKKGKKSLKFDLTVIVLLQLCALSYGIYHVYAGRPVWIVYNVDRFDLVRQNEIYQQELTETKSEYQKSSITGPKFIAAIIPKDIGIKNKILFEELGQGIAPSQRSNLYEPLETAYPLILKRAQDLSILDKYNSSAQVKAILAKYPQADSFVPLKANALDMTVLINKKAGGKIVKIVDLRPWK